MRVKLCLFLTHPFLCHANADPETGEVPVGEERICAGYVDALAALGHQPATEAWERAAARDLLAVTDELIAADRGGTPLTGDSLALAIGESLAATAPSPDAGADLLEKLFLRGGVHG
jgi:hypothetical protein